MYKQKIDTLFLNTCFIGKYMLYYNNRGRQNQFEIFPAYKIDKKI